MKYKIGIFGSSVGDSENIQAKQDALINILISRQPIILIGIDKGLHYEIGKILSNKNIEVWGYSPAKDFSSQQQLTPQLDLTFFKKIIFVSRNFPYIKDPGICRRYRSVLLTADCDAGIIISGGWGTVNEFTNLQRMEKPIGIISHSGGFADELPGLLKKFPQKTNSPIIFNNNPALLVDNLLNLIK